MLHEKPVAVKYMFVDVQRECAVEKLDIRTEERRGCTGLDIGTNTSLCQTLSRVERVDSEGASTFLVITYLGFWVILLEHGEQSDNVGILREVNRINDTSGLMW